MKACRRRFLMNLCVCPARRVQNGDGSGGVGLGDTGWFSMLIAGFQTAAA